MVVFQRICIVILVTFIYSCKPELVITPWYSVAKAGEDFSVTCTTENEVETFAYRWLRDDKQNPKRRIPIKNEHNSRIQTTYNETSDRLTLLFSPVKLQDTGRYSCEANGIKHYFLESAEVKVFECEQSKLNFVAGENITLGCSASVGLWEDYPRWEGAVYPNITLRNDNYSVISSQLRFVANAQLNGTEVRCVARTHENTVSECKFKLNIGLSPPMNVFIDITLLTNGTYLLKCNIQDNNQFDLVYKWSSNVSSVFTGEPSEPTVLIPADTLSTAVIVTCFVQGNLNDGEMSLLLDKEGYSHTEYAMSTISAGLNTIYYIIPESNTSSPVFITTEIILFCLLATCVTLYTRVLR
ncbi:uncharacterized protein [Antedon mediterranea]|uniref:uncharacterized protein n=1 Tax=Antedon mediterranea TaxID=105859 RepID=UPI003AF79B3F